MVISNSKNWSNGSWANMNKNQNGKRYLYVTHLFLGEAIHSTTELSVAAALKRKGWKVDFIHPRNELGRELF